MVVDRDGTPEGAALAARHQALTRLHWGLGEAYLQIWHLAHTIEVGGEVKKVAAGWLECMDKKTPDGDRTVARRAA